MPIATIREAVRRKSVGLSFTANAFGIFNRSQTNEENATEGGEQEEENEEDDQTSGSKYRTRDDSYQGDGSDAPASSPAITRSSYVEPPEPPLPPPGGLLEAAAKNVQGKMKEMMETFHEVTMSHDDASIQCSVFLSKTALFSDRLVVFIGDSDGCPAGVWSARLCVRSGSEGGGIYKGSLGSMLPYIVKAKEDKLGIVLFDDLFKDFVRSDQVDMKSAVVRFMTGWRNHVLTSRATHVFVVAYRDGGQLFVEALRSHFKEMQRHISGVAFIQSTHRISPDDSYVLRKMIAQWCISYLASCDVLLARLKPREHDIGCVCLSAGCDDSDVNALQAVVDSVYAGFKARWSGFRVKNVNSGMEKACYLCKNPFNMRRWRRHCRTCQNPVCEKCSAVETTRHEGQVRLCLTCHALPSLIHWSRPRAVRTGEKESVFSGSAKPGKMSVNDFELVTVIGRGACGKVLLVQKKDGVDAGKLYAMKVLKKDWVLNKDLVTQTMAERRILQEANHPYIVQLKYAFQNQDKLYMVMEYYSGGSLRQVLRRRGRFSIKRARFYLGQILLAIAHLHGSNILYRDLKLENIVITADGNVACTDFGLSKEEMDDGEKTSSFVGTCEYLAPELILKEGYGKPVDWWAFGILAFEMIQGDSPFRHNVPTVLFEKILKDEPIFSDRFTPESKDLITKLLNKDPSQRLGCGPDGPEEIKRHPFFAEIDWDGLLHKRVEVPRPPHRMEDVTDESHLSRAIARIREAREELMPDSPVSLPSSPSEQKHFDRFSYQGLDDWHPSMASMKFDEATGDFQPTIAEDEEFVEEQEEEDDEGPTTPKELDQDTTPETTPVTNVLCDGDSVPISPLSLVMKENNKTTSSPQSPPVASVQAPTTPSTPLVNVPATPSTPVPEAPTTPIPEAPTTPIPEAPSTPKPEAPSTPKAPSTPLPVDASETTESAEGLRDSVTPKSHFF